MKNDIRLKDVFGSLKAEGDPTEKQVRIGVGFVNQDGSINVILDHLPLSGRMQLRDRVPIQKKGGDN